MLKLFKLLIIILYLIMVNLCYKVINVRIWNENINIKFKLYYSIMIIIKDF